MERTPMSDSSIQIPKDGDSESIPAGDSIPNTTRRILVVDDEESYREYLARFLSRYGFDVRTAETGAEAIEVSREFAPDILVTDCVLHSDMQGIEVGERLRQQWPDLRILLMTGFPTERFETEAERLGINGFLEKPFSLEDLSATIEDAFAIA
jgi:DNA-binding response OmpR family regulator